MKNTSENIWIPAVVLGSVTLAIGVWTFSKRRRKQRVRAKIKDVNNTNDNYFDIDEEDNYIDPIAPSRFIKEINLPDHLVRRSFASVSPIGGAVKTKVSGSKSLDKVAKVGDQIVRKRYQNVVKPRPDIVRYDKYYSYLQKEFEVLQLGVQNNTDKERIITLWGANEEPPVTRNTREDIIDKAVKRSFTKFTTKVGVHPQGILVNPSNNLIYVANQLSDSVSVLNAEGMIVDIIKLSPNSINGHNSPVAFAVHSQANATNYGKIYVAGSVSNTISILDAANTIVTSIPVGKRPVACGFHSITADLFVCNLLDHTVSVIDSETETVIKTLDTGLNPRGIVIDEITGNIFVMNSGDNSISVFNQDLLPLTTISDVSKSDNPELVSGLIHPENNTLFVVATNTNEVIPITLNDYNVGMPIGVGSSPHGIVLNTSNNFMYIGNREDNTISVVEASGNVLGTIQRDQINIGLAYDRSTNAILTSDTTGHMVQGLGFFDKPAITIDGDYMEKREEFKYANAYIKHVKFILSGEERFKVLSLLHESVTGKVVEKPIAFSGYNMPQNFQNISEVFELEKTILDGKHRWRFKIAAQQKITILIYYYQLGESTKHQKTIR